MDRRMFHIGDILSVTTEKLLSPRHVEGLYDILNFMTGDNLFTHQLPRANRECKPCLLRQYPQLVNVTGDGVTPETWQSWLDARIGEFGETLEVEPIPMDDHDRVDPIAELEQMVGPDRVIAVVVPEGGKAGE